MMIRSTTRACILNKAFASWLLMMMMMMMMLVATDGFSLIAPFRRVAKAVVVKTDKWIGNNKEPLAPDSHQTLPLLDQLMAYTNMPLDHAVTFPPEAYTNEDLFQVEIETIFRPGWICVAHVSQIRAKGDYVTLDLLGERLVVVNSGTKDGATSTTTSSSPNIKVLSRVCSHRWASICETGKGSTGNKFTCPMHRWSFDLEGNLLGAPYMDDVADFKMPTMTTQSKDDPRDNNDHGLHTYRSTTIGGFVYVNIDGTAEPLEPQIAGLTEYMENWETDKAELFNMDYELNYECDFNWVRVVFIGAVDCFSVLRTLTR